MPSLLRPPHYDDPQRTQAAYTFDAVAWAAILVVTGLLVPVAIINPGASWRAATTIATVDGLVLFTIALSHYGWTRTASWLLVLGLLARVSYNAFDQGGLDSPGVDGYFIFPLMAAVLLGPWEGLAVAVLCVLIALGFVVMTANGLLPRRTIVFSPTAFWMIRSIFIAVALWMMRLAIQPKAAALKRAEDELAARLEMEAARALSERHRQTLEHQLRQSQKMEALGTLAGGIAHDFNNILMVVLGNAALAADSVGGGPAATYLDEITQAGQRGADMVRRILLFGRRAVPARRPVAIDAPLAEAVALLRPGTPSTVQITTVLAPDLPMVTADTTQLHQVFVNLGANAIHAMESTGGGLLSFVVDAVWRDRSAGPPVRPAGRYLRIAVRDTGSGMQADVAQRLFEPFFTTKSDGTGLGLAVVHGIVREHGGLISVDSKPGLGTTFTIELPATMARAEETPAAAHKPMAAGRGEHIIYVDDEAPIVFLMSQVLQRLGYRCTGFSDPEQALAAVRLDPFGFDAVVTDLSMPGLNGVDLARCLRDIRPDLPIAMTSGYVTGDLIEGTRQFTSVLIQKPATPRDVATAMQTLLRAGRMTGEVT